MNKLFLISAFTLMFCHLNAQQVFQKGYTDLWGQSAHDIIQTADGGYVIAGTTFEGTLFKTDGNGDSLWCTIFRDTTFTGFYDVLAVTECMNTDLIAVSADNSNSTILISRLTASGDTIWNKAYTEGGMGLSIVIGLKELSTGDIGLILRTSSFPSILKLSATGDLLLEQTSYESSYQGMITNHDEFIFLHSGNISKLDINGNLVWSKTMYVDQGTGSNYITVSQVEEANDDKYLVRFTNSGTSSEFIAIFDSSMSLHSSCLDISSLTNIGGTLHFIQTKDDSLFFTQSNNGFSGEYRVAKYDSSGLAGSSNHYIASFMGVNSIAKKLIPTNDSGVIMMGHNFFQYGEAYLGKFYKGVENGDCESNNSFATDLGNYSNVSTFSSTPYSPSFTTYYSSTSHYLNKTDVEGLGLNFPVHDYNNMSISFSTTDQSCAETNYPSNPNYHLSGMAHGIISGGYPNTQNAPMYSYYWTTLPPQDPGCVNPTNEQQSCLGYGWAIVSVSDSKCSSLYDSVYINGPDTIDINISSHNIQCAGILVTLDNTISGGTTPYNFAWNDEYNNTLLNCDTCPTPIYTADSSGYIYLQITDDNYCRKNDSVLVEALLVDTTPICMVSVDSTSTKNLIVWSKPSSDAIDYFNVYRDIVGTYTFVASVPYDSLSQYVDTANGVNPNITQYRYKISSVDTCGYESPLSEYHQTIWLASPNFTGSTVELSWQAYDGFDYNFFYRVLRDSMSNGDWEIIDSVSNTTFVYSDIAPPTVNIGTTRYLIEIAFAGLCSATKAANYSASRSNRPTTTGGSGATTPVANFSASSTSVVAGNTINFSDLSSNNPTSWSWIFDGATPSTATAQNPGNILYSSVGSYGVTLTATNSAGNDSETKVSYITVVNSLSGDIDGNGIIDGSELAGDSNNDGIITGNELAGDLNGNGVIDNGEIAGDVNGNGIIDSDEVAGDVTGDGIIGPGELTGDIDGNGFINVNEVFGDANGNGILDNGEATAIQQIESSIDVNLYPNPNSGYFVLELNTSEKIVNVNIYNSIGQRILSELYNCNGDLLKEYNLSNHGAGIYNIEININGQSTSKRLIVK